MAHSALQNSLAVLFRAAIGAVRVIDDEGARQHAASDIGRGDLPPCMILAPRNEAEVIALVNAAVPKAWRCIRAGVDGPIRPGMRHRWNAAPWSTSGGRRDCARSCKRDVKWDRRDLE